MNSTKRNATSISSKAIVWMFVIAAAALSAHDIVTLFERIGAPAPLSFLAPVFIDGVTWLGKLMRSHSLSKTTNSTGLVYLILGGGSSLAANLTAGQTLGMKLLGLLAVTGFILGEIALDKIEPRPEPAATDAATPDRKPSRKPDQAELDARKRAGYAGKSAAEKTKWTAQYRDKRDRQTASAVPSSPAPAPGPVTGPVPTVKQLADAVR